MIDKPLFSDFLCKPKDYVEEALIATRLAGSPYIERIEDRSYFRFPDLGIAFDFSGTPILLQAIFFYGHDHDDVTAFESQIISGVSFSTTRDAIRKKFGMPNKYGNPQKIDFLGEKGAWDRYDFGNYSVHFSYTADSNAIELITLMCSKSVPGASHS